MPIIKSDANEYECPHCHAVFEAVADDQWVDDVRDETVTVCVECGETFILRCVGVDLYCETGVVEMTDDDT